MRIRLLVMGIFVAALLGVVSFAYDAGLWHESDADAQLAAVTDHVRLAILPWTQHPGGLTASESSVLWTQPGAGGGLWTYDARRGAAAPLLQGARAGMASGAPRTSGATVVWTVREPGKPSQVRVLDVAVQRVSQATSGGVMPTVGADTTAWVWRHKSGDLIGVLDTVTGERASIPGGRVHDLSAYGRWVAWTTGAPGHLRVWSVRFSQPDDRYLLARDASSLTMDAARTVWAAQAADGRVALVAWDRRAGYAEQLAVVPGPVTSLTLTDTAAAWTRRTPAGADIWSCDLRTGAAAAVTEAAGDQLFPVFVGSTLYWADHGNGRWELCARTLHT
jgi:hypothetical protein